MSAFTSTTSPNGPDIQKVRPLVFTPDTKGYCGIGRFLGEAFSIGNAV